MSRFSVIKSKGKFYVVAKDTNTLAGGPFLSPEEAGQRSDRLNVLEVAQAVELKKRQAAADANRMNIQPGYRSPDVEDGRSDQPPLGSGWASYDWWQHPPKLNDRAPPRGPMSPSMKNHIPVEGDPVYAPPEVLPHNPRDEPGMGGPFDWATDRDQAELAKRQAAPPKGVL